MTHALPETATRFGYVRVSVATEGGDNLETQRRVLREKGVHDGLIFADTCSGTVRPGRRPGWTDLVSRLRPGDRLMVKHPDRLARNLLDGLLMIRDMDLKGVTVEITDFGGGTGNPDIDRLILQQSLSWAEWAARDVSRRVKEGHARALAQGKRLGRPPAYDDVEYLKDQAKRMKANGLGYSRIAKQLSTQDRVVPRSTVRSWLKKDA